MELRKRLRILHIIPVVGVAGAEQMMANLLIPLSSSYSVGALGLYASSGSVTEAALQRVGVPTWDLGKRSGFDPAMFGAIHRVLKEFRPDIVHSHLHVLRYSLPAAIRRQVPVSIHTVHNLAERESDRIGRMIRRVAFRRRVVPVAVSQSVAESLTRVYGIKNAIVIPNGIPVDTFRLNADARAKWRQSHGFAQDWVLFIATGRLTEQKNPLLLLRAFASVGVPGHLVLVGDGPMRHKVEEEVRSLGLTDRVHLLGYRSDVRECLAASDVFVLSSDWEGHPLGVMEAMASGLPVIATAVGGVPELVEERKHGFLVNTADAEALSGAMRFLLDRADVRKAMGEAAGRRALTEFRVERMARAYAELYDHLFSRCCRNGAVTRTFAVGQVPAAGAGKRDS